MFNTNAFVVNVLVLYTINVHAPLIVVYIPGHVVTFETDPAGPTPLAASA